MIDADPLPAWLPSTPREATQPCAPVALVPAGLDAGLDHDVAWRAVTALVDDRELATA